MNKEEWATEKFGRWVKEDEIIIEDLEEKYLLEVGEKLGNKGYRIEYWKCPKQESGHIHIKEIKFNNCPDILNDLERMKYKELLIKKYISQNLWEKVDWNFTNQKRHRIAEENKSHFKGYGIKELIKIFGEGNENRVEKKLYHAVKNKIEIQDIKESNIKYTGKITISQLAKKRYGIETNSQNRCYCPFHTPLNSISFMFDDKNNYFRCWSCGERGNVIHFVKLMEEKK